MAKITKNGLIGSIGSQRFFITEDGPQVALKGGPTRKRVLTDPNYASLRKRMVDFGACSSYGKTIRKSLRFYKHLFKPRFNSYLTGILNMIIKTDQVNPRGKRTIDIKNHGTLLEGSEFCARQLKEFILQDFPVTVNEMRSIITIQLPAFYPTHLINFPKEASAFSLFMTVTVMSKYAYNESQKQHVFVDKTVIPNCFAASTDSIPKLTDFPETELVVDLEFEPNENQGLIICFGIEFYEPEGYKERLQKGSYAMKVVRAC